MSRVTAGSAVKREIRARLVYLGMVTEELAVKAHMNPRTLNRRLENTDELKLGEQHRIEKALGWEHGTIGRIQA